MTTKKDRGLLELAAKAAGYDVLWLSEEPARRAMFWSRDTGKWNPLTDDGDALRLAVKLALEIRPGVGMVAVAGDGVWEEVDTGNHTREEATRRAIVRAAAAMAGIGEGQ